MINMQQLRLGVCRAYSAVAQQPEADHPFRVGRAFADALGYPRNLLDRLPAAVVEAFTGVSNVSIFAEIPEGASVLDLGCGAGLDSLIAAQRVGPRGQVIGIDFSQAMLARASCAAESAGLHNVKFGQAEAEHVPLDSASVDIAMVNGIFNLNLAREAIFSELARVVRSGGTVYAAELILGERLPPEVQANATDWFA